MNPTKSNSRSNNNNNTGNSCSTRCGGVIMMMRGSTSSSRVLLAITFVLIVINVVMATVLLREETWAFWSLEGDANSSVHKNKNNHNKERERIPLYLITPSGNPSLLTRSIFYVLPFIQDKACNSIWDVHWVVVHSLGSQQHCPIHHIWHSSSSSSRQQQQQQTVTKAPLFRNVFSWITELYACHPPRAISGNHERNIGIEHVLNTSNESNRGFVYFLDDDNVLSMDLCTSSHLFLYNSTTTAYNTHNTLPPMYYADQDHYCGQPRRITLTHNYYTSEWRGPLVRQQQQQHSGKQTTNPTNKSYTISTDFDLIAKTDTATWLTPLWLLRIGYYHNRTRLLSKEKNIRWNLEKYDADGYFFTALVKLLLHMDGNDDRLVRLPPSRVQFHYNHLTECLQPQLLPDDIWKKDTSRIPILKESLQLYRDQIQQMEQLRRRSNQDTNQDKLMMMMDRPEVSFHEYVHILYLLRSLVGVQLILPKTTTTTTPNSTHSTRHGFLDTTTTTTVSPPPPPVFNFTKVDPTHEATYVEIGVWKGATSIFLARHSLPTRVIGIDDFLFQHQRQEAEAYVHHFWAAKQQQQQQANNNHNNNKSATAATTTAVGFGSISWIESDSKLAVPQLKALLKTNSSSSSSSSIDILFIDGNHSLEGVEADFELYAPLVAEGGFIVLDDFMDTGYSAGVREAVWRLVERGTIHLGEYDVIGCLANTAGAGSLWKPSDKHFYDWQSQVSNEFVLRKKFKKQTT